MSHFNEKLRFEVFRWRKNDCRASCFPDKDFSISTFMFPDITPAKEHETSCDINYVT